MRCESYEYDKVRTAVRTGIDLLGGPGLFARSGEKILFKPNWLVADPPEKLTVTHPMVFKAMVEVFKTTGATLQYGDSPAIQSPETAARVSGFASVASSDGVTLADFKDGEGKLSSLMARREQEIRDCQWRSRLRWNHQPAEAQDPWARRMPGCVKNQFGCIPGALKGEFHVKLASAIDFARMLVDLNSFLKPRLYVMDGIIAMEGNVHLGAAKPDR